MGYLGPRQQAAGGADRRGLLAAAAL